MLDPENNAIHIAHKLAYLSQRRSAGEARKAHNLEVVGSKPTAAIFFPKYTK